MVILNYFDHLLLENSREEYIDVFNKGIFLPK